MDSFEKVFAGKNILVTGGAGSIGSEIVRQLLKYKPKTVRVFDSDENGLFNLQQELCKHQDVRFLLGDIRDKERIMKAMENIDIVFHAAALKHVPSCEYNPFEAIKTNINGTQNVVEAALEEEVEKFINISTDKAANPISTMGATKLLAEKLVVSANYYKGNRRTILSSVRFGNVIGSRGSVLQIFKQQIRNGGPVTITNSDMTRFIMSINQAVNLIFKATEMAIGGEVFILKMPVLRLKDLYEVVVEEYAPRYNIDKNKIKIENVGMRAGERVHEHLMREEEALSALETENMFIILPQVQIPDLDDKSYIYPNARKTAVKDYSTKNERVLNKEEIRKMLSEEKLLD